MALITLRRLHLINLPRYAHYEALHVYEQHSSSNIFQEFWASLKPSIQLMP
jgi:hypothetical protein